MLLVNLIGAPGAGKSTQAAGLFHMLKKRHWNAEIVTEYTKELILTNNRLALSDELLVFAEKYRRIKQLQKVDIVITDSPLINSMVYGELQFGPVGAAFFETVARTFDSIYFVVRRKGPYIPVGRMPDEAAAEAAGDSIVAHLRRMNVPWWSVDGDDGGLVTLCDLVEEEARRRDIRPLLSQDAPLFVWSQQQDKIPYAPGLDAPPR